LSGKDDKARMAFLDIMHIYTHRHEFIEMDAYNFDVDYENIWSEFTAQYIDGSESSDISWNEIEDIYSYNSQFVISLGYDSHDLDTSQESLLYFNTDGIDSYFKKVNNEEENETAISDNDGVQEEVAPITIIDTTFESISYSEDRKYTVSEKAFKVRTSKAKKDKKIGESAEKRVYKELQNIYGDENVIWKSKEDDGAHYDIRYMPSPDVCKYVEVKSFMRGCFDISKDEIAFGKEHPEDYEIWLVDEEGAYPIRNFFDADGKPNFHLNPRSFEVVLKKIEK
jgi:hypothetical protein